MKDVPVHNFSSQAPLPHETSLRPLQQVRKRKSTIGEHDKSSRKNVKMSIEGGGSLDNLETREASSRCPHLCFHIEKDDGDETVAQQFEKIKLARMEKAQKLVREQKWVIRSRCTSCSLPITWQGICKACEREGERGPEPFCILCRAPMVPGRKCKACSKSICNEWLVQDEPCSSFDYETYLLEEAQRIEAQLIDAEM